MKKFYDPANERVVYVQKKADSAYWDNHWSHYSAEAFINNVKVKNRFVLNETRKYLPKGAVVLEGGCGQGQNVWTLQSAGFDCWGADFAADTVEKIKKTMPELKVVVSDVRKLSFEDNFFDGYWSLGVIEHFFDGYHEIRDEMRRVLKKGGYLFLTVPAMSFLRQAKARLGFYEPFKKEGFPLDDFYQFVLSDKKVIEDYSAHGFRLVSHHRIHGVKGLKDEVQLFYSPLQKVYDSKMFAARVVRKFMDESFRHFSNHMSYFVLQKV